MSLIQTEGTFRGNVLESGVNVSKGGFPQLLLSLRGIELWDEETSEWVDWSAVPENDLTAYLILIDSKDKQTFNYKKVQEVFGWNGVSFAELDAMDLSQIPLQFRVASNTYQEKTTLQVEFIDAYDAVPGRTIRKLDAAGLRSLDAKFKGVMKGAAPAKAPAKAAAPKAPKAKAPAAPKAPVAVPAAPPSNLPAGTCTKAEAWEACVDMKDDKIITDENLSKAWTQAVAEITPGKTDAKVTPEEWFLIREAVLAKTAMF